MFGEEGKFDLILTSETIYNTSNQHKLISIFKNLLKKNGQVKEHENNTIYSLLVAQCIRCILCLTFITLEGACSCKNCVLWCGWWTPAV